MSVSTIITKLAVILKKLADRDAARAAERQKQFKKAAAARALVIRNERLRAEHRVAELLSDEGQAQAAATLGLNEFNEQERKARVLSRQLDGIAG